MSLSLSLSVCLCLCLSVCLSPPSFCPSFSLSLSLNLLIEPKLTCVVLRLLVQIQPAERPARVAPPFAPSGPPGLLHLQQHGGSGVTEGHGGMRQRGGSGRGQRQRQVLGLRQLQQQEQHGDHQLHSAAGAPDALQRQHGGPGQNQHHPGGAGGRAGAGHRSGQTA